MRLSLLVLTCRRDEQLLACLDALAAGGPPSDAEVVVGLNDEPPGNERTAALVRARHPRARLLALERCPRGEARNRLAAAAEGELLYFLDDDTIPPPGFAARAAEAFARWPGASALGGPNLGPPGAAAFPRAVDFLLRSPLGAGPMAIRHRAGGPEGPAPAWVFTLSNFGARRAAFEEGHRFPARAASAEETLFLHELLDRGGLAVHVPSLFVHHRRRPSLGAFLRQTFSCGLGRAQITRAAPRSLHPAVLAPVLSCLAAPVLLARWPAALAAAAGLYFAACAAEALRMALGERDAAALLLAPLFPLAHAAYAAGVLAGLVAGPASDAAFDPRLLRHAGAPER